MKKTIRLTESDLHRIVMESVKQAINEIGDTDEGQYDLGRAAARRHWRGEQAMDDESAMFNFDYADSIANHAAMNTPDIHTGKNFDYGYEDYIKAIKDRSMNNA